MTVFLKELRSTVICLVCQGSDGKKGNFVDIAYMSNTGTLHINAQRGEVLENPMLFFIINKAFAGDGSAKDDRIGDLLGCMSGQGQQMRVRLYIKGREPRMKVCQNIGAYVVVGGGGRDDGIEKCSGRFG